VVIGMISTVVDALTVGRIGDDGEVFLLYGASAIILAGIGIMYAGLTDRTDKRRLLTQALLVSAVVCLGGAALLLISAGDEVAPLVLAVLFVWRFVIGIVLLMVFWDLTPFYFDARQGKRLFPVLAIGGAVGYSLGSLAAAGLSGAVAPAIVLVIIGGGSVLAMGWFLGIRRSFSILDAPRYRDRSVMSEVREGVRVFRGNAFLRAVALNTFLFGVLAGLIVFTYNAIVSARTSGANEAAGVMGYQRAAVTMVQAIVLTKVMSQSATGGSSRTSIIQQVVFLAIGVVAFAVSMVGVADFTRQIEVALMSPAAMAAFAFLPGRYRGRVMVLNNLVAAAGGILVATVFVALLSPLVDPLWFVYPMAALLVARIVFGVVLNRRYTALLSESIVSDNKLNLARLEENTVSFVRDEALLQRLGRELPEQSTSVQVFVLSRLARGAETYQDIDRIAPFFRDVSAELQALWVESMARVDYERYREPIEAALESPMARVRRAAQTARLRYLSQLGRTEELNRHISTLQIELHAAATADEGVSATEMFRETADMLFRVEEEIEESVVALEWDVLPEERRLVLLELLAVRPRPRFFELLLSLLHDPRYKSAAIPAISALSSEFLLERLSELRHNAVDVRLELVRAFQDPVLIREESVDLLAALLPEQTGSQDSGTEPVMLDWFVKYGEATIEVALTVLSDPTPIPAQLAKRVRIVTDRSVALFPEVFQIRFASEEDSSPLRPLIVKLVREQLDRLALVILILHALNLPGEDDRRLAYTVCRELSERAAAVQHNTLEFIESKVSGDVRSYLMTVYEQITVEEKRGRLRSLLRRTGSELDAVVDRWRSALAAAGDETAAELYGALGRGS
jgi:AAA family ATP:ADP antiporter